MSRNKLPNKGWMNLVFFESIILDRIDGQRIVLKENENLLLSIDSIAIRSEDNSLYIIPAIQILQIHLKRRYGD